MITRYPIYRERLTVEWVEVRRAAEKAIHAHQLMNQDDPEISVYLDSVALNLHGFYNGLERIFEWLARQLDNTVPDGRSWHHDLLLQMSLAVAGVRPAVIQSTTRASLEEFLGFRHLVRNVYTWDFDAEKVHKLVTQLPDVLQMLETDLTRFKRFLDAAGRADEIID